MKGFNKIVGSLWAIAAFIFWIQGCLGIGIGEDYVKPFLEAICCTGFAIYYKLDKREDD